MNKNYRVSIVIPCFGRPQRTIRMLNCIADQTINNFEVFIIGDGCIDFQNLLESEIYNEWKTKMISGGNSVISFNTERNFGGHGYEIINYAIKHATGNYFMFAANDDVIAPDHLEFYLSEIENTDYDMVCYSTLVRPWNDSIRVPELRITGIGHSEIIVKTELAKKMPPHTPEYGHDWYFIENLLNAGAKVKMSSNMNKQTYHVMSVGPEKNRIDSYID